MTAGTYHAKQTDYECFPEDLAATIYTQLGIDPHAQLMANGEGPVRRQGPDSHP